MWRCLCGADLTDTVPEFVGGFAPACHYGRKTLVDTPLLWRSVTVKHAGICGQFFVDLGLHVEMFCSGVGSNMEQKRLESFLIYRMKLLCHYGSSCKSKMNFTFCVNKLMRPQPLN